MKKLSITLFLSCLWQISFAQQGKLAQNPFYRYQGQVITLQPDASAFVIFNSNTIMGGVKL